MHGDRLGRARPADALAAHEIEPGHQLDVELRAAARVGVGPRLAPVVLAARGEQHAQLPAGRRRQLPVHRKAIRRQHVGQQRDAHQNAV